MKKYQETINLRERGEPSARNKRSDLSNKLMERSDLLFLVLAVVLVIIFAGFWVFWDREGDVGWYAVKLVNEEIYYGRISDLAADPVVMSDVYYNYSQDETGNIRLIKRGNETHGPAGTMNIPRSQVVYMESLSDDSKVLKAILENE